MDKFMLMTRNKPSHLVMEPAHNALASRIGKLAEKEIEQLVNGLASLPIDSSNARLHELIGIAKTLASEWRL